MSKNKKLIFTVNLCGYDELKPIENEPGYDYICFTNKDLKVKGWKNKIVNIKGDTDILRLSRELKICPHLRLKGYDTYVYIDANMIQTYSIKSYVERYFKEGYLAQIHPSRKCVFKEAERVLHLKKELRDVVIEQMRSYTSAKFPRNYGLFENGVIIRDNTFNSFCEKWMEEISKGSYRDQLSLPFALWKYKPKGFKAIDSFYKKRYISVSKHKRSINLDHSKVKREGVTPKVWYFVPGRGDKNLGKAYNDHCELVPDGDYICIMDGDVMFLNPFWSKQIEDIIIRHHGKFPMISCVTNRLGLDHQLPYGFSDDPNVLNHAEKADKLYALYYDDVVTSIKQTAGLFMLFPKSTWNTCKFDEGLTNGGNFVDFTFATKVMEKLGKIGIARGLYLFHFYRFNRKNKRDIDHLL